MNWLENLQRGYKVIEREHDFESVQTVLRTTSAQIVLSNGKRYRKKDGHLVGYNGIYIRKIIQYTDAHANTIVEKVKRDKMLSYLRDVHWRKLSNEVLESVCKLLDRGVGK